MWLTELDSAAGYSIARGDSGGQKGALVMRARSPVEAEAPLGEDDPMHLRRRHAYVTLGRGPVACPADQTSRTPAVLNLSSSDGGI
jgi:hypothetical protein